MRLVVRQIAVLLAVAMLPALAAAFFHPKRPSWQSDEVPLSAVNAWAGRVIWIDARPAEEFAAAHIPEAVPLREGEWDALLPALLEVWEPDRIVVVYCSSLSCAASHEVAARLRDEVGLEPVRVLQGGWEAWRAAQK